MWILGMIHLWKPSRWRKTLKTCFSSCSYFMLCLLQVMLWGTTALLHKRNRNDLRPLKQWKQVEHKYYVLYLWGKLSKHLSKNNCLWVIHEVVLCPGGNLLTPLSPPCLGIKSYNSNSSPSMPFIKGFLWTVFPSFYLVIFKCSLWMKNWILWALTKMPLGISHFGDLIMKPISWGCIDLIDF